MKICPYCQSQNPDSAVLCTECMKSIGGIAPEPERYKEDIVARFLEKEERREKRHDFLLHFAIIAYYIICVPVYILLIIADGPFFPVIFITALLSLGYYLCIFKPKFLFMLEHRTTIDNIDDVELSDWYFLSSKICGFLMLGTGLGFAIYTSFEYLNI